MGPREDRPWAAVGGPRAGRPGAAFGGPLGSLWAAIGLRQSYKRSKRGPPLGGLWGAAMQQAKPIRWAPGAAFWLVARGCRHGVGQSVYREPNPIAVSPAPITMALPLNALWACRFCRVLRPPKGVTKSAQNRQGSGRPIVVRQPCGGKPPHNMGCKRGI